jgi:hypothetical protein
MDGHVFESRQKQKKKFSLFQNVQTGHCSLPSLLLSFLGIKRPGRDFDHSPPSSAEVKNECICISTPPILVCLHSVERETLYLFKYVRCQNPVQGIHKRMVRFQKNSLLIPHHSFVYALYMVIFSFLVHEDMMHEDKCYNTTQICLTYLCQGMC